MNNAQRSLLILCCLSLALFAQRALAQDFSNIAQSRPFSYSGSIEARGMFYHASGIQNRRQPTSFLLSGSPTFDIYGLQIPLNFSISEADKSFTQPFNQYGLSPTYKWITLHAGYRNVSFSPYTLGGHTMLGAGFELNPGKLRVGFMYGRLNKATTIDTTRQALIPFSFSRKGYAAKLGYGSANNFFELSYLRAKDDDNTRPADVPTALDLVSPAKNNVLGYSLKFTFFKNLFIESTGAVSLYTNDINSPINIDSIQNDFLQKANGIFKLNATSEYYTAFSSGLGYRSKNYGVKINYKRIEPDFKTMGAYFFNSDLENWTISPNVNLLKGKVRINGSIGFQHDNLEKQKRAENKRVIASANAGVEVTKELGFDLIYTNFSDNQTPQTALFADSLRIVQTNQTFGIMPRYFLVRPEATHVLSASASFSSLNDYNNFFSAQAASRNISTNQYFINYNLTFPKKELSLFANLNNTKLSGQNIESTFSGATFGATKTFFKQNLQSSLSCTLTNTSSNMGSDSFITNINGSVAYKVSKKQKVAFNFFVTNNKNRAANPFEPNFTETRAELIYLFNF
ncbi:hypothetical protein [Pedobacter sp. BMA]|uniref:hypothetical protein n=1 Tax=Pedobacter sp. BMA TaxID=1663685 RepID=UPI00064ABE3F|nr:hypothetical protein [Pedobacter sp. BMA]KLT66673.1 hypothetical protein AB669_05760 [Pedobacter sp. BMA]